jgi:hypothetical protein
LFDRLRYDERIWGEIRAGVEVKTPVLLAKIQREVATDRSLERLPSRRAIIWQRADGWVQDLYAICCDVNRCFGRSVTEDFDRVVWVYCIEPFILSEPRETGVALSTPGLLELLLRATGSPPEKRNSLRVSDKKWCIDVRSHLFEAWRKKLLNLQTLTRLEEAAAAMARYEAIEKRAKRIVAGLPPDPLPLPETLPDPETLTPSEEAKRPRVTTTTNTAPLDCIDQELPKEKHPPLPPKHYDYSNLMDPADLTDLQHECYSLRHEYQLPVVEIARRLGRDRRTIQEHIDSAENKIKIAASKDRAQKRSARFGIG